MNYALHTTSDRALMRAAQAHEDMALAAHLDAPDLSEMTYPDLLEARDEASEHGDWMGVDEYDDELRVRQIQATIDLHRVFIEAMDKLGILPCVVGGKLTGCEALWYLTEALNNDESPKTAAMLVADANYRFEVIASLAKEFVKNHGEELLKAGWSAQ